MIQDITKTEYNNCFIIRWFEENNDNTPSQGTWINIVVGNHALRAQPITNLSVGYADFQNYCSCRLLANKKTDNEYNVLIEPGNKVVYNNETYRLRVISKCKLHIIQASVCHP